jgi:hypothetical protein
MTENEKAATFIGWQPGQRCEGVPLPASVCWRCSSCGYEYGPFYSGAHSTPAPDMSDPRNYMKALEMVRVEGEYYPEIYTNGIGWLARFGKVIGPDFEDGSPFAICRIAKSHADLGSAVTRALAALYDARASERGETVNEPSAQTDEG